MAVVVLNGTSSSGKTTIARAVQELALPRLFLNISIDTILYTLPPSVVARMERGEPASVPFLELVRGFCACVRELAALGHDLVVDHAVSTEAEAEMLRAAVADFDVLMVGIDCPVDVLNERERLRGDRRPGLAALQCERVHQWFAYDLRIDSARVSADDAARQILAAVKRRAR